MGKASRLACIIVPEALSVASLICLLLVFLAGMNKNDSTLRSLYYFKANTTGLKNGITSLSVGNVHIGNIVNNIAGGTENISDFYEIYMWNYCRGSTANGTETVTYCSPRKAKYSFDPFTEWGLSSSSALKIVNGSMDSAVKAYQKGSAWLFVAYCVAFWVTVATIVVGLFAICSRVGSCLTTFVSSAATLFTIIAAVASTILFSTVVGALNASLSTDGIHSSLGTRMIAVDWLAVAFSLGASFFWLISICCCSPHSSRRKDRGVASNIAPQSSNVAAFAPFGNRGYQPLADPVTGSGGVHHNTAYGGAAGAQYGNTAYGGRAGGVEMQDMGYTGAAGPYKGRESAYEPFRHDRV